jgi:hypothetical protein
MSDSFMVFFEMEAGPDEGCNTPEEAARYVYDILRDPDAIPPVLEVYLWPNRDETVPPRIVEADGAEGPDDHRTIDCEKLPPA